MHSHDRTAGGALALASAGVVLAMAHHPTGLHSGLGQLVHGTMLVLLGVTAYGLFHFALRQGIARPAVLAGAVAYAIGTMCNVGAATISGFAAPAMAAHAGIDHQLFIVTWELNQALAKVAVAATGAAFLLWSLGLFGRSGWMAKTIAVLGVAAGVAPVLLLGFGALRMNVAGAMIVYAMQAGWMFLIGVYLFSGRFEADRALSASDGM
jgi:hypothetical protein